MRNFALVTLLFTAMACGSKNSPSSVKHVIGGGSGDLTEDGDVKGVCLLTEQHTDGVKSSCKESTLQNCRSSRAKSVRTIFTAAVSCACYELEKQFESELLKHSSDDFLIEDEGSEDSPIEIGAGWDDFYAKHPECKASATDGGLLP